MGQEQKLKPAVCGRVHRPKTAEDDSGIRTRKQKRKAAVCETRLERQKQVKAAVCREHMYNYALVTEESKICRE